MTTSNQQISDSSEREGYTNPEEQPQQYAAGSEASEDLDNEIDEDDEVHEEDEESLADFGNGSDGGSSSDGDS